MGDPKWLKILMYMPRNVWMTAREITDYLPFIQTRAGGIPKHAFRNLHELPGLETQRDPNDRRRYQFRKVS